jgi:hypothetical protein
MTNPPPIDPRAERRDAAAYAVSPAKHLIRLATELEEIAFRKLHPDISFNTLVLTMTPTVDDCRIIDVRALPLMLPVGEALKLPTDPTMIDLIVTGRYQVIRFVTGLELVGLQEGLTPEIIKAALARPFHGGSQ